MAVKFALLLAVGWKPKMLKPRLKAWVYQQGISFAL